MIRRRLKKKLQYALCRFSRINNRQKHITNRRKGIKYEVISSEMSLSAIFANNQGNLPFQFSLTKSTRHTSLTSHVNNSVSALSTYSIAPISR